MCCYSEFVHSEECRLLSHHSLLSAFDHRQTAGLFSAADMLYSLLSVTHCTCFGVTFDTNSTNTSDNIYSAVVMTRPMWEFSRFIRWIQTESQVATKLRPSLASQLICAVSPPVRCHLYTHCRNLLLLLSPKADTNFTVPQRVEGWVDLETQSSVESTQDSATSNFY